MTEQLMKEKILGGVGDAPRAPHAYYSRVGDCVKYFAEDGDYFAKRLDEYVTVYYAQGSEKVIGAQIKSIKKLARENKGVAFIIEDSLKDGNLYINELLTAYIGRLQDIPAASTHVYRVLRTISKSRPASVKEKEVLEAVGT